MKKLAVLFLLIYVSTNYGDDLPRRAFIGIQPVEINDSNKVAYSIDNGVLAARVIPGSSAEIIGLKAGDILLSIGEEKITSPAQFLALTSNYKGGDEIEIYSVKGGEKSVDKIRLVEFPRENPEGFDVVYDHVMVRGNRLRTITMKPDKKGKQPAILFIQGVGAYSVDFPFPTSHPYRELVYKLAEKGFVVMRAEKSGMGDSEGPRASEIGFNLESEGFLQALKKLKTYDFVDTSNVFIFGHSMGGVIGPVVISEESVKGIAVYGTLTSNWMEYEYFMDRSQMTLAGTDPDSIRKAIMDRALFSYHFYLQHETPLEIIGKFPQLEDFYSVNIPDSIHIYGIHHSYIYEIYEHNLSRFWKIANTNVAAIYGLSDFVAPKYDHIMIADIVNQYHPGKGRLIFIENADHAFKNTTDTRQSLQFWGTPQGIFNDAVIDSTVDWLNNLINVN